jgi:hypothetical protein
MLLLWEEHSSYWQVGLGYALVGIGVGFAGTPASHSLTGSVPVQRAGMASGTADLQRDLGGAIMRDAELGRDRADRRPLRGMLVLLLEHHPDGPLPQLGRVPPLSGHSSNLSRVEASRNPGAVRTCFGGAA